MVDTMPMPRCSITGLPALFCAHCQNGLPRQLIDDPRGFRRGEAIRMDIGFPSLSQTITKTLTGTGAHHGTGQSRPRISTPNPSTRWGQEQRDKTFSIVIGRYGDRIVPVSPALSEHPPLDKESLILLGRVR